MKNYQILFFVSLWLTFTAGSCGSDPEPDPIPDPTVPINMVGNWLLSTSDAENWISYQFTESSQIKTEFAQSGYYGNGSGYYNINGQKVSASYKTDRGLTFYVDWVVNTIKPFEISLNIYDDKTLVGDASIYRVLSTEEAETGITSTPDYRGLCGTGDVNRFAALDKSIADVDAYTGAITGKKEGVTFITFRTPNGTAAIKVSVKESIKTFAQQLVGTWVYDKPSEKVWEVYTYTEDGYVSIQWQTYDGTFNLDESAQGLYEIKDQSVSFSVMSGSGQLNMRLVTESINDFNWTYSVYDGNTMNGKYTVQRLLGSHTFLPEETLAPNYQDLVGSAEIQGYESHNKTVASVNANGEITANSKGRTYIDIITNKGTAVFEVNVEAGAIPVAFEQCIGKGISKVHQVIGDKPSSESETSVVYKDYTDDISEVKVSLQAQTGIVNEISVQYKSSVKISQVTSILNAVFVPYADQSSETVKKYLDTENSVEASVEVTWDLPNLKLTYVNLVIDLFPDYSSLLGLSRNRTVRRMGREPDSSTDTYQAWLFLDNKGVFMVSAYFSLDLVTVYNNVCAVGVTFDDTLSVEQITNYLMKKYSYFPEYSTDTDLTFVPEDLSMVISYQPQENLLMYIKLSAEQSRADVNNFLKSIKSLYK